MGVMVRQHFGPLRPRTPFLVDLVVADLVATPDGMQGRTLRLISGQVATFGRASAGEGADTQGQSYTAPSHHPALRVTTGRVGVLLRPADAPRAIETLAIPYLSPIAPHSGYLRCVDRGAGAAADSRYLQWGTADAPRLILLRGGSGPAISWSSGDGNVGSQPSGHPTSGQLVELWWRLTAAGEVLIERRFAGGSVVSGTLSAAGLVPPQAAAEPVITVGGGPGATNVGGIEIQVLRIHPDPDLSRARLSAGTGL